MKFIRSAIVFLMVNYSAVLFCQEPVFTREFESLRGNVPMKIINPDGPFLPLTIQQTHSWSYRWKAEQGQWQHCKAHPLKLDSVNANWFDYDNLDYLFFKSGDKLCFAFEKVLNTKRSILWIQLIAVDELRGFANWLHCGENAGNWEHPSSSKKRLRKDCWL